MTSRMVQPFDPRARMRDGWHRLSVPTIPYADTYRSLECARASVFARHPLGKWATLGEEARPRTVRGCFT